MAGDDVFISYARADGAKKAIALARHLKRHKLTYYFDRFGSRPGREVPPSIKRHVKNATMMVVVCTSEAAKRPSIRKEIDWFQETDRDLQLMGDAAAGRELVEGLAVLSTPGDVIRAFRYTRLMVIRRRVVAYSTLAFMLAGLTAGWLLHVANENRYFAMRAAENATNEQQNAFKRTALAQKRLLSTEKELSVTSAFSVARQLANQAAALDAQPRTPARAVLLTAVESLRHAPTPTALEIAQRLTPLVPEVTATRSFEKDITAVAISPSGDWYSAIAGDGVVLYSRRKGVAWRGAIRVNDVLQTVRWIAFSPDEAALFFNEREGDLTQVVHRLALEDVKRSGRGARPERIVVAKRAEIFFFSLDDKSLISTRKAGSIPEETEVFPLTEAKEPERLKVDAMDADASWIVGTRGPFALAKLVAIPRAGGAERLSTCGGRTAQAMIAGDAVFSACVTRDADGTRTEIRKLALGKDPSEEMIVFPSAGLAHLDVAPDGTAYVVSVTPAGRFGTMTLVRSSPQGWTKSMYEGSVRFASGGAVVFADSDSVSVVRDALKGDELARWYASLTPSADGRFAVTFEGRVLRVLRLPSTDPERTSWELRSISDDAATALAFHDGRPHVIGLHPWRVLYSPDHGVPELSPRGNRVAMREARTLRFLDPHAGGRLLVEARLMLEEGERISTCSFSGDERSVLVRTKLKSGDRAAVTDVRTGKSQWLKLKNAEDILQLSTTGAFLVRTRIDETVTIESLENGAAITEPIKGLARTGFASDDSVAAIAGSGGLSVVDLKERKVTARVPLEDIDPQRVIFRADGKAFFITMRGPYPDRGGSAVHVFDREGNRVAHVFSPWQIYNAAWMSDTSIVIADGTPWLRTLSWDVDAVIGAACAAVKRDVLELQRDDVAKLPAHVFNGKPCGVALSPP